MATMTYTGAVGAGTQRKSASLLTRIAQSIRERLEIWHAQDELSAMNDRELRDIGVSREQIPYAVRFGKQ
ncbi:DUF1127 domain-containing protein [Arenibaculum pallidiluteum]|uniref:DUF1127 domain-containing protein n=1 Tax=Arenibaculum pallidiluteum TaxID=2812559 RepID=UPI001A95B435|nr:DUF1127 domain-containing protein [Arenibaculum pallidiluteum]